MHTFAQLAEVVAEHGFHVLPVPRASKATTWRGWQKHCGTAATPALIANWVKRYPDYGLALCCGHNAVAIDIDDPDAAAANRLQSLVAGILDPTPLVRFGR